MRWHLFGGQGGFPDSASKTVFVGLGPASRASRMGFGCAQNDMPSHVGHGAAVAIYPAVTEYPVFTRFLLSGHNGAAAVGTAKLHAVNSNGDAHGENVPRVDLGYRFLQSLDLLLQGGDGVVMAGIRLGTGLFLLGEGFRQVLALGLHGVCQCRVGLGQCRNGGVRFFREPVQGLQAFPNTRAVLTQRIARVRQGQGQMGGLFVVSHTVLSTSRPACGYCGHGDGPWPCPTARSWP